MNMTCGQKFITFNLIIAYMLPFVGRSIFGDSIITSYKVAPISLFGVAVVMSVYFLFLIMSTYFYLPKINFPLFNDASEKLLKLYNKSRIYISFIVLLIGVANCSSNWEINTYRYATKTLSEQNSIYLFFVIVVSTIISADLFYWMFIKNQNDIKDINKKKYLENLMLSSGLVMFANGTASAFLAFCALIFSLIPNFFRWCYFYVEGEGLKLRFIKSFFSLSIILIAFVPSWFYGESIKTRTSMPESSVKVVQHDKSLSESSLRGMKGHVKNRKITQGPSIIERIYAVISSHAPGKGNIFKNYVCYFIESMSIYYYSYLFTVDTDRYVLKHNTITPLIFPLKSFIFRLDHVSGSLIGVSKPSISSISQLNYQLLTKEKISERTGSSPGLLGSFNYIFSFPFNIIFCVIYLYLISDITNNFFQNYNEGKVIKLSTVGFILLFPYMQIFFQSPFDFFEIIDNCAIYAFIIIGIYLYRLNNSTYKVTPNNEELK